MQSMFQRYWSIKSPAFEYYVTLPCLTLLALSWILFLVPFFCLDNNLCLPHSLLTGQLLWEGFSDWFSCCPEVNVPSTGRLLFVYQHPFCLHSKSSNRDVLKEMSPALSLKFAGNWWVAGCEAFIVKTRAGQTRMVVILLEWDLSPYLLTF